MKALVFHLIARIEATWNRIDGIERYHKFKTFYTFVWFLYSMNVHMSKSYNSMHFIQRVEAIKRKYLHICMVSFQYESTCVFFVWVRNKTQPCAQGSKKSQLEKFGARQRGFWRKNLLFRKEPHLCTVRAAYHDPRSLASHWSRLETK